jgi:hypothetical protein
MYSLLELTGLSSTMDLPLKNSGDVAAAVNANEYVILGTLPPSVNTQAELVSGHEYAVLNYSSANGGVFLLYNPWGLQPLDTLSNVLDSNTNTIPLADASDCYVGEILELDQELMLVTGVGNDSITVKRGYDNTNAATHTVGAYLSVCIAPNSSYGGSQLMAQGEEGNNQVLGLIKGASSFVGSSACFVDMEYTTESFGSDSYATSTSEVNSNAALSTSMNIEAQQQTIGVGQYILNPLSTSSMTSQAVGSVTGTGEDPTRTSTSGTGLLLSTTSGQARGIVKTLLMPSLSTLDLDSGVDETTPNWMPVSQAVTLGKPQREQEQVVSAISVNHQKPSHLVYPTSESGDGDSWTIQDNSLSISDSNAALILEDELTRWSIRLAN